MNHKDDTRPGVDEAINRVLAAEQAARERVSRCHEEGDAIVARAETEAAAISQRAERRIRAAHRIADRGIERALAELRNAESPSDAVAPDTARIKAVVTQFARELTEPEQ